MAGRQQLTDTSSGARPTSPL
jgi:hypothetical protein